MGDNKTIYNNYSEKIRPILKKGETATFQLYNSLDPITGERRLVEAKNVPSVDRIWDEDQKKWVQIAAVKHIGIDGTPELYDIWLMAQSNCMIVLSGKTASNAALYEYFKLCNYNASNPNRDPSVKMIIEEYDPEKVAREKRAAKKAKRRAVRIAEDMSDKEVRTYWRSKGQGADGGIEQLRTKLEDYAEKDPNEFLKYSANPSEETLGILKKARADDVIMIDKETKKWVFADGAEICPVSRKVGTSEYQSLVNKVEGKDGSVIFDAIKKGLKE